MICDNEIIFEAVKEWDSESIVRLYRSAGWWSDAYDPGEISKLIRSSHFFVVGVMKDTRQTIAMGRILSDYVKTAIIQDMCVLPEYKNHGIGEKLLSYLINIVQKAGEYSLILVAEPGTINFYQKSGFIADKNKFFYIYNLGIQNET